MPKWEELPPLPEPDEPTKAKQARMGCITIIGLTTALVAVTHGCAYVTGPKSTLVVSVVLIWIEAVIALYCLARILSADPGVLERSRETCMPLPLEVAQSLQKGQPLPDANIVGDDGLVYCVRCLLWRREQPREQRAGHRGEVCGFSPFGRRRMQRRATPPTEYHHCSTCQRCVRDFDHHCGVRRRAHPNTCTPASARASSIWYGVPTRRLPLAPVLWPVHCGARLWWQHGIFQSDHWHGTVRGNHVPRGPRHDSVKPGWRHDGAGRAGTRLPWVVRAGMDLHGVHGLHALRWCVHPSVRRSASPTERPAAADAASGGGG